MSVKFSGPNVKYLALELRALDAQFTVDPAEVELKLDDSSKFEWAVMAADRLGVTFELEYGRAEIMNLLVTRENFQAMTTEDMEVFQGANPNALISYGDTDYDPTLIVYGIEVHVIDFDGNDRATYSLS